MSLQKSSTSVVSKFRIGQYVRPVNSMSKWHKYQISGIEISDSDIIYKVKYCEQVDELEMDELVFPQDKLQSYEEEEFQTTEDGYSPYEPAEESSGKRKHEDEDEEACKKAKVLPGIVIHLGRRETLEQYRMMKQMTVEKLQGYEFKKASDDAQPEPGYVIVKGLKNPINLWKNIQIGSYVPMDFFDMYKGSNASSEYGTPNHNDVDVMIKNKSSKYCTPFYNGFDKMIRDLNGDKKLAVKKFKVGIEKWFEYEANTTNINVDNFLNLQYMLLSTDWVLDKLATFNGSLYDFCKEVWEERHNELHELKNNQDGDDE